MRPDPHLMTPKDLIARRVAQEIRPGTLVNLGIGIPTRVSDHLPEGMGVFFQSENGVVGLGHRPPEGMGDRHLTDAGGSCVSAVPGASIIDSAFSFGLIRGGHLDLTVLGGLQVDARGRLANWMIPGEYVPGMGGAMDLVTGAKRVIVAMLHCVHPGVVVGVVKMADLGRGMGQVNAVKAITERGGVVQVFEREGVKDVKPSKPGKLVLTDEQRAAACAIWGNSAISEASRLHRIHAIDGMPQLDKNQIVYQCVTKPKRQQK